MHVRGRGPAEAEAGVIGRDQTESSMFCARMPLPRFHKTQGQAPHAYSIDEVYEATSACKNARTYINMHVGLS
eukprot:364801-Chlamydomonas_euryale.AAC.4